MAIPLEAAGYGGAPEMATSAEFTALAAEYECGLIKMTASGYEEFGMDMQRRHKLVIAALRAAASLRALAELPPRS